MSRAPTELRLPLRHLSLAARCWGDASLPPLLALHGWLDNAASFDGLAPLLETRHVVAIDMVGHGRSDWRNASASDYWVDYLDDIDQVFRHFAWNNADLLGHSLGGTLASTYAAAFPERVSRLVLIEALGPLSLP
ncbi:MAG: alpha/beta fold hydrolase, partial [Dokdonella sp.]